MMVASIFAVVERRIGGQDDRLAWVKAELKCDQEPSTLDVANASIKRCQSTSLIVTATPKRRKGAWSVENKRI